MADTLTDQQPHTAAEPPHDPRRRLGVVALLLGIALVATGVFQSGVTWQRSVEALVLVTLLAAIAWLVFGPVTRRATSGDDRRLTRTAAVLAVLSVVTIMVFWSGLPVVLGVAAANLGVTGRRRSIDAGHRAYVPTAALTFGTLAVVGAVVSSLSEVVGFATAPAIVEVRATEYGYVAPATAEGTLVSFQLINDGHEPHEFAFAELEAGHSVEELRDALVAGTRPDWVTPLGGVPVLSPGREVTLTRQLDGPGTYVFLCFLPTPTFDSHLTEGMITAIEVTDGTEGRLPDADLTFVATDDGFEVPAVPAGPQMIEFRNDGEQPHEFWLVAFDPGAGDADVEAWFADGQPGPAPATYIGGMQTIPPGTSVYQHLDLEAGVTYTLADYTTGAESSFTP